QRAVEFVAVATGAAVLLVGVYRLAKLLVLLDQCGLSLYGLFIEAQIISYQSSAGSGEGVISRMPTQPQSVRGKAKLADYVEVGVVHVVDEIGDRAARALDPRRDFIPDRLDQ